MKNLKTLISVFLIFAMAISAVAFELPTAKAWGETFILDAGHGGTDPGACAYGREEADDVLRLTLRVGQLISTVNSVTYTRTTDIFVDLNERCNIANGNGNKYFCSIHRNSGGGTGVETYYYTNGSATSAAMAGAVNDRLAAAAPWRNRGVKTANFVVVRGTNMPSILTEVGFIDSENDNALFDAYFEQIAYAIANGLLAMTGQSAGAGPAPAPALPDHTFLGYQPIDLGENFVAYIRNTVTGRYFTSFFDNVVLADSMEGADGRLVPSQQWHFYRQADGSYCISNDEVGKMIDVAGGIYTDATNIQLYPANGLAPQKFYIYYINGNFYFRCHDSTKVIDANLETNNVQIYGDDLGSDWAAFARAFEILKFNLDYGNWYNSFGTGSTVYIRNVNSGKLMTANGTDVNFYDATYGDNQKWRLHRRADGSYVIISDYAGGLALDVSGASLDASTAVNLANNNNTKAQGFYILPSDTEDYFVIKPCYTSNVLDMDAITGDLHIYPPNFWDSLARNAQIFEIVFENIVNNWLPPAKLEDDFYAYITNEATGNTFTDMGDDTILALPTTLAENQIFHFVYDPATNAYQIFGQSGKAIEPMWGAYTDNAPLLLANPCGALHQRFRFYDDFGSGYYYISPAHTNKLVDNDAGTGTNIHLFGSYGNTYKKFKLTIYNKEDNNIETDEETLILKDGSSYSQDGEYLLNVTLGQTAGEVLLNFKNIFANVYDKNGNLVADDAKVATGYTVDLVVNGIKLDSVTIIIKGDVNGDATIDSTDYLRIKSHFLEILKLNATELMASDIDSNSIIDATDYLKIKSHFLGTLDIFQTDAYAENLNKNPFEITTPSDGKVINGGAIAPPLTEKPTFSNGSSVLGDLTLNYNSVFYGHDSAIDRDFGTYADNFKQATINGFPVNEEAFINEFTGDFYNDVVVYKNGVLYIYPSVVNTNKTFEYNNQTIASLYGDEFSTYGFASPISFTVGLENAVLRGTGDFDGNGYNDFLFITKNKDIVLGLSSENGIALKTVGRFNRSASKIHCGDVDGNGYCDIILVDGNVVTTVFNDNLSFSKKSVTQLPFNGFFVQIAVGDMNDDGRADIVTVENKSAHMLYRSLFGRGDGFFGPHLDVEGEGTENRNLYAEFKSYILNIGSFSVGDMNGDGIADLLPNQHGVGTTLLINHGEPAYDYSLFGFVKEDGTYVMYSGGRWCDRSQACQNSIHGACVGDGDHVMYYTSKDGINWERKIDKPMFYLGSELGIANGEHLDENWWAGNTLEPEVVYVNGVYHMLIQSTGLTQSGYYGDYIGYASSTDGINWERKIDSPVILPREGANFTQFKELEGCEIGFNHHELIYVADDPDGKCFHLYTGHFVNNVFSGYVRIRSADPTRFYWNEREAAPGFAQIGNQIGYISNYNGKGDRLYLRITFCDYEDADGKRSVPTLQYSFDGLNFTMSDIRLASVDVSDPITERNRNVYFLGFCTLNGTGEIVKNENGNYELVYLATTANDPGSSIHIFYADAGVGKMEFTLG